MIERLSDLTHKMDYDRKARAYVLWCQALAVSGGAPFAAQKFLEERLGERSPVLAHIKTAMTALDTSDGLSPQQTSGTEFLELARRRSILGRMVALREVPFNTTVPVVSAGATGHWVGETAPKPNSALSFTSATLPLAKLVSMLAVSRELMASLSPQATSLLERDLQRAITTAEDGTLLDDQPAVAQTRPAGLLYGLSAVGGGSPASLSEDAAQLWQAVRSGDPIAPIFIMSARAAVYLMTQQNTDRPLFPDLKAVDGGTLWGVPVLISPFAAERLILVDQAVLNVADDGILVDASDQADVQLTDTPLSSASAIMTSSFQANLVVLRVTRFLFWALGYSDGAAFIDLPIPG